MPHLRRLPGAKTRTPTPEAALKIYAQIGRRMKMARAIVYGEQQEFARVMGMDKSTLNKIEAGTRGISLLNLLSAGEKLRTGTDFLLKGDLRLVNNDLLLALVQRHPQLLAEHRRHFGDLPKMYQSVTTPAGRPSRLPRDKGNPQHRSSTRNTGQSDDKDPPAKDSDPV